MSDAAEIDRTAPRDGVAAPVAIRRLLARATALEAAARGGGRGEALADRLAASVLRPLRALAGDGVEPHDAPAGSLEDELWELAQHATETRPVKAPPELLEATAALQHLALAGAPDAAARERRHAELVRLQEGLTNVIELAPDGPYLVTNPRRLEDWLGAEVPVAPQLALCRCGQSAIKPLCDGSHATTGFRDAKEPDRVADRRDTYVGQQVTVLDNRGICQHSGLCTDRLSTVFRAGEEPFVAPSGGRMDEIIRAVRDCPSGALSYAVDGVEARADVDWHGARREVIQITRDGPYRITGAIPLVTADGEPVARAAGSSAEHYALCRCGRSQNKPFCSGMHWYVEFRDPALDPEATPTMFEWAGGLPALNRMTRLFYEKFVPEDPLLAPLFAHMSPDHPERVAKWLGEVFGGPKLYSSEYGGYPRMLSQHVGKNLQEGWRRRWVELLLRSAAEAGLPNDPEFRSAFQAYIEWGSRLAVENSQSDAHPPEHMPMPRWDWNTAAGPPGSRVSALAPPEPEAAAEVVLPAAGEPVGFERHVRPLFRERDRRSMSFAFDLWSCEDVRAHATAILGAVREGSMPCDGKWPPERVDVLARWVDEGMAE